MKRLVLITIMLSLVSVACTDVLNTKPQDQLNSKSYWSNANQFKIYMNQFYPDLEGRNSAFYVDRGAHVNYYSMDDQSDNIQTDTPSNILDGTRSVPATSDIWSWGNIRDINIAISHFENLKSDKESDQIKGEGYFFRAYFYFDKLKSFGAVPIFKKPLNTDSKGLKAPREPRSKVVDFIILELNKAIKLLNPKSQGVAHRINKSAAMSFKSRVELYEGTWEKYHFGTPFGVKGSHGEKYLKMAAQTANKVISTGNFGIYSTGHPKEDYFNLFNRLDLTGNSESILSAKNDGSKQLGGWQHTYLNGKSGYYDGQSMTKQLVDAYLDLDGKPIGISNEYKGDTTITQVVKNRDPRLEQSMWVPGTLIINYPVNPTYFKRPVFTRLVTGYMVRKGSSQDPKQNTGASRSGNNNVSGFIFRYAEVLLNYAEAKAELGIITQADLDKSVNLLRKRVGMPKMTKPVGYTDPNWNFPNLSPIINEIRRERRVELALEGFRYDDLMRWAAGDYIHGLKLKGARYIKGKSFPNIKDRSILSNLFLDKSRYIWHYKKTAPDGFGFNKNRDYLYPLPIRQLTLNENLKQNPGWSE